MRHSVAVMCAALATSVHGAFVYEAPLIQPPQNASYVLSDGSIYIVGDQEMRQVLGEFNELFVKTHPGVRFKILLRQPSTALSGLTAGVSAFAPTGREAWPLEVRPFRQLYGYEPTDIHIGRHGYTAAGRTNPPGVYINASNPLAGLTTEQAARIFVAGAEKGDLTHWNQLGLTGDWAKRVIHVYGPRDNGGFATSMRHAKMGGLPFAPGYEALPQDTDVIQAVAEDPYGIGLVGFFDSKRLPVQARMVRLAKEEGGPYSIGSYDDVFEGKYAYAPHLHVYLNRVPGQPLDRFLKEYVRLLLSEKGQAVIRKQKDRDPGFVPLNPEETFKELAKLE